MTGRFSNGTVVGFGEILLRLTAPGHRRFWQAESFDAHYGGSEANAAVSLANYGTPAAFVTRLPDNALGQAAIDRLLSGEELTYMVYGDSISTGCEALYVRDTYFARFADRLQRVTGGKVDVVNEAIGGETSREGLSRFAAALERHSPHLVSIAYGINDMCVKPDRPADLTPQQYIDNVRAMVDMARAAGAEVILITNCLPNPHWRYTSAGYKDYAAALRVFARAQALPIADVQALWERELAHGKRLSDLLFNDVNHPTSYGHYLYAAMLETLI